MKWLRYFYYRNLVQFPSIEEIAQEIPAVYEDLDVMSLPEIFKYYDTDTVPVIDIDGKIIGIVSEYDLAQIMPEISILNESYRIKEKVGNIMSTNVWCEYENTNIRELFDKIPKMHTRVIPIIDRKGIFTGKAIIRTNLINYLSQMIKPQTIGGLATPLGVYLTDGIHQAGAKTKGLIALGAVFAITIYIINNVSGYISNALLLPEFYTGLIELSLFLVVLRLSPFSKIHAAEHMVINTIERGLPLTAEAVKTQSPVHERCGTNIMVFILGILCVTYLVNIISPYNFYMKFLLSLVGFLFVFSYWKQIGRWTQKYLTTAFPDDKKIKNGIKAGKELLEVYKKDVHINQFYPMLKIWNSGFIQIIFTFMVCMRVLEVIFGNQY